MTQPGTRSGAQSAVRSATTLRRTHALFDAMSGDHLFREQFVTDPTQIYSEYVHGAPLDRQRADVLNQFVYAVISSDELLRWAIEYRNECAGGAPPDSELAMRFGRAVVDTNSHHVALALMRASSEQQPIFPLDPALKDVIFGVGGRGRAGSQTGFVTAQVADGTEISTGTGTGTEISTGTGTGTEISTGTGTGTEISTGTGTGTEISTGTGTGTEISTGTGTGTEISTGTGTGTEISTGTGTGTDAPPPPPPVTGTGTDAPPPPPPPPVTGTGTDAPPPPPPPVTEEMTFPPIHFPPITSITQITTFGPPSGTFGSPSGTFGSPSGTFGSTFGATFGHAGLDSGAAQVTIDALRSFAVELREAGALDDVGQG